MPKPLARVTDPDALQAAQGPRAQLSIQVPQRWFATGVELELVAPKRLACQRCEGGGCDSCHRTGVWRTPPEEMCRTLRLHLPVCQRGGVTLRLVAPFEDSEIDQLFVNIRSGDNPSKGVRRLPSLSATVSPSSATVRSLPPGRVLWLLAAAAMAAAAALAAWL